MSGKKIMSAEELAEWRALGVPDAMIDEREAYFLTLDERARVLRAAGLGEELIQEVIALHTSLAKLPPGLEERTVQMLRACGQASRLAVGMILAEHARDGWSVRRRLKKALWASLGAPRDHLRACTTCRAWIGDVCKGLAFVALMTEPKTAHE